MRLDQPLCITRLVFHFVVVKSDRVFEELRVLLSTDRSRKRQEIPTVFTFVVCTCGNI